MFQIIVISISIITIALLGVLFNINLRTIKNLECREKEELEKLSKKFPEDEKICKDILEKLNNNSVNIKSDLEYNSCLYTIFNNRIIIGNFKQNYMKIQTLAHECIHACQNKRMLWGNFVFSNMYYIFFIVIFILTLLGKISNSNIYILILIFAGFIQYIIRFSLENEAMIKAIYISKEYIEDNNILNQEEKNKLLEEYNAINKIGIPFTNFYLISSNIIKVILYTCISLI